MRCMPTQYQNGFHCSLTKYEVGEKTNPPKNPNSPPKKGMQIATKAVRAVMTHFV